MIAFISREFPNMIKNLTSQNKNQIIKKNNNFLSNFIPSKEFLAQWTQTPLSENITDIIIHFIMSFSSFHTRRSYFNDLKDFINFTEKNNTSIKIISEISEKILISWNQYLNHETELTQKSIRRKLNTMSSLFEFCKQRKLIDFNPMTFIKKPKYNEESKTNAFTLDEVKQILNYLKEKCDLNKHNYKSNLNYKKYLLKYTVIHTLFAVGMRVNELCELKIKDIEFSSNFCKLHMIAKGKKEHSPVINPKTALLLKEYLSTNRNNANENEFLFVQARNVQKKNKLTQVAIYYMITNTAKELGINKKVSPHSCRATLATILHNQGVPLIEIQNLLNHKDIATTSIYIKKANEIEESAALKLNF
ncbi:MAG: hypothetical protein DCC88_06320 [Spirobacillus cienkowskii]|uniref:Integrase n=2 Tax=Spirobacillus cienkowskii TaxID=495820 RepID=A0A369KNN6_9BACT|nr:MAG: hypothetical protein DCC88_06320 [Spirobacillus cienkowskii]